MWQFWRRHKRKVFVTLGVLGSGYLIYELYETHRRKLSELEQELATVRQNEERIKAQMQEHFEKIQQIADSTTLPHVMQYLSIRIAEKLDLTPLTERLMKGKGQPNMLTAAEKIELWDKLKILSFTRMVLSLWTMTILSLYIRVQVNILGRHLYIDTARDLGSSLLLEEADLIDRNDEQQFLATADFLSSYAFPELISSVEAATSEVLRRKQLKDLFNATVLHETLIQILDTFMSMGSYNKWMRYLIPEDLRSYKFVSTSGSGSQDASLPSKFEQLMMETRAVISSAEFGNVLDVSLKVVADALVREIEVQPETTALISGMPLAKLVPRIAHTGQYLLEEPNRVKYIRIIHSIREVELFFTVLYSSMLSP